MVNHISATNEVKEYKYSDLSAYIKKMRVEYPEINKFIIAIDRASEYEGKVYASGRFIIRLVMLKEDNSPIIVGENCEEYLGTLIIADTIDAKLNEKMGGETKKTFRCSGGK